MANSYSASLDFRTGKGRRDNSQSESGHGFELPIWLLLSGYLNYTVLFVISWIKELLYGIGPWRGKHVGMLKEGSFR